MSQVATYPSHNNSFSVPTSSYEADPYSGDIRSHFLLPWQYQMSYSSLESNSLQGSWEGLHTTSTRDPTMGPFLFMPTPEFSPSPSNNSCSSSMDAPSPLQSHSQSVHVICNAPLVAPIPLPYHSPTFLKFELPDIDQDLSHPPYTQRSSKRKRAIDEDLNEHIAPKRRGLIGVTCDSLSRRRITRHQASTSGQHPGLHNYT